MHICTHDNHKCKHLCDNYLETRLKHGYPTIHSFKDMQRQTANSISQVYADAYM